MSSDGVESPQRVLNNVVSEASSATRKEGRPIKQPRLPTGHADNLQASGFAAAALRW